MDSVSLMIGIIIGMILVGIPSMVINYRKTTIIEDKTKEIRNLITFISVIDKKVDGLKTFHNSIISSNKKLRQEIQALTKTYKN